jgi:hypothetical protein
MPPHIDQNPLPAPIPARWFAEEVQPHEASLRAYMRGAFPMVRDVDDVVQESYLRVWRARAAQPIPGVSVSRGAQSRPRRGAA